MLGVHLSHWWQWLEVGLWLLLAVTTAAYLVHGLVGMLEAHAGCAGCNRQRCREGWIEARNAGVTFLALAVAPAVFALVST